MPFDYEKQKCWYIVKTMPGKEQMCKQNIEQRTISLSMQDYVFRVLIPEQPVVRVNKKGEQTTYNEKIYPGTVFVEMICTDDSWYMVRNTPLVTGIIGSSGGGAKPVPVGDEEMVPILKICGVKIEVNIDYKVGDEVMIVAGDYEGLKGIVESIDPEKGETVVSVDFIGQSPIVHLALNEVKPIK